MHLIKKLLLAPLFLSLLLTLFYLYKLVLDKYLEVFLGKWGGIQELGLIALVIIFASLTYCLYISFAQDIKYHFILAVIGSFIPFIFLQPPLALIAGIGFLISLSIAYFNLSTNLKTYVNFAPVNLLSSPVKTLNTLLLLSLTLVFYFHSNSIIQQKGFKLPEPIIDWAIELSLQGTNIPVKGEKYLAQAPTLTQDQINLLKENPQLLEQFGLKASDLDQLTPTTVNSPAPNPVQIIPSLPTANLRDIIKAQITDSLERIIKPYLLAIPIILAFLFYSLVSLCLWILSFFLSPTILLIFYLFEKTGFIKFEKEMREVKKMVV